MKLSIDISIGNEGTLHSSDLADLLRKVASKIAAEAIDFDECLEGDEYYGNVQDRNGNTVGEWRIE